MAHHETTMRCACPTIDRYDCIRRRYPAALICDDAGDAFGYDPDPEPCECPCHDEWDNDDEY